jgi:hypothetical protein
MPFTRKERIVIEGSFMGYANEFESTLDASEDNYKSPLGAAADF